MLLFQESKEPLQKLIKLVLKTTYLISPQSLSLLNFKFYCTVTPTNTKEWIGLKIHQEKMGSATK